MIGKPSPRSQIVRVVWDAACVPFRDLIAALDAALGGSRRPSLALLALVAWIGVLWFLYVPAHELLHSSGCLLSGGQVQRLQIGPLYGGGLLERWIPFVEASGGEAGRLSGFTTGRSDLRYLATVAAPYALSVAFAAPLLRGATRRRSVAALGPGALLALVPFLSLGGDYYEIGSILVTRAEAPLASPPEPYTAMTGVMSLRSDDLAGTLIAAWGPGGADRPGVGVGRGHAVLVIALSAAIGLALAWCTYAASAALEGRFHGRGPAAARGGSGVG